MRVRMKNLMGVMEGGSMPALSNLEEAMKAEQKVPCFSSVYTHDHTIFYLILFIFYMNDECKGHSYSLEC